MAVEYRDSLSPPKSFDTFLFIHSVEKVLEKLGTTESTTLAIKREVGGKIRVTSLL